MKQKPMRWRKFKMDCFYAPPAYELHQGGKRLAMVQETSKGWFFYGNLYGQFHNTSQFPVATLEEVKADAVYWVKTVLALNKGD